MRLKDYSRRRFFFSVFFDFISHRQFNTHTRESILFKPMEIFRNEQQKKHENCDFNLIDDGFDIHLFWWEQIHLYFVLCSVLVLFRWMKTHHFLCNFFFQLLHFFEGNIEFSRKLKKKTVPAEGIKSELVGQTHAV